jgi:ZIP family zinc transporter
VREWFYVQHPVLQALLAGTFTWGLTALGASAVFLSRTVSRRSLDAALGFTAGVMTAASFWSLLAPAIEIAGQMGMIEWLPAVVGFLAGAASLRIVDRLLPHIHIFAPSSEVEGVPTRWRRSVLLVLAITLHNIPEGLAVGVAFGAVAANIEGAGMGAAIALALGIGLQNFPEGLAVAVPLRNEGLTRSKSFFYGQLSAVVEPVAAVVGAALVVLARPLLPYALAYAAGAMFFVVVEEVVPESQRGGNTDLATLSAVVGFTVMMALDVALS